MKKTRNYPLPVYKRRKWGIFIFNKILINGETERSELRKLKDTTGKKISRKMLSETLNAFEKEDVIEKIPSKETGAVYDFTSKFRAKKLNQLNYIESMDKDEVFLEIRHFQHTVYGLPKFEDMEEGHKRIVIGSINKIDDALLNLKNLGDNSPLNIALLSTYPIRRMKTVEEHIELKLDELFKDGLLYKKKSGIRIEYGNLVRFQEVILAGMTCRHGNWVNNEVSKAKFVYHKNLKQNFTAVEIKFMLYIISEIVKKNIDFKSCDLEKFIIFKGFNDGGLWYDGNKSIFYNIAENTVKSIDTKEFYLLGVAEIHNRIKSCILENPNTPPDLRNYDLKKYGLSELISYINSKIYFEKTWEPNEKITNL